MIPDTVQTADGDKTAQQSPALNAVDAQGNGAPMAAVSTAELDVSFAHCREVVKSRARNFYYGLRLTPEPRRSAIYAVYAWMRCGDDIVDEPGALDGRLSDLKAFRAQSLAVLDGAVPTGSVFWPAFANSVRTYTIDHADLNSMLAGLGADLEHEQQMEAHSGPPVPVYASRMGDDGLQGYCYNVASVVGRVCVDIWGLKDGADKEQAGKLAETRGLAFQLTNILRDFCEDYDEGRVYLPQEDFDALGITPEQLRAWTEPKACAQLVSSLAGWARTCYTESARLDTMLRADALPAMWAMTRIYSGILRQIEKKPQIIVGPKRVSLSAWRKVSIALRAFTRAKRAGNK